MNETLIPSFVDGQPLQAGGERFDTLNPATGAVIAGVYEATEADVRAARTGEEELKRRWPAWEAQGLIPTTEVPPVMEDRRPREYGMRR